MPYDTTRTSIMPRRRRRDTSFSDDLPYRNPMIRSGSSATVRPGGRSTRASSGNAHRPAPARR